MSYDFRTSIKPKVPDEGFIVLEDSTDGIHGISEHGCKIITFDNIGGKADIVGKSLTLDQII